MKLIYQQLLGFFLIIITTVLIIGYAEINYVTGQSYNQNFQRMENYASTLQQLTTHGGRADRLAINSNFLKQTEFVFRGNQVRFRIFDNKNRQIFPKTREVVSLPGSIYASLKRGQEIRVRNNNHEPNYIGTSKTSYTGVLMPWFSSGKFVGFIWIGSTVYNVERPISMAKKNLLNAFLITLVVALFLSLVLAYYSSNKIKRLSKATDKVSKGDFNVHITHKGRDEIDQLAANFNRMVRELKKSNDEIKAQERRRDQFMADVAHEMRTPLTTINGILEGLQYDAIPEEAKPKSIALMGRETKRLIRLVNENLDYEKIRNNQIMLSKREFDCVKALQDLKTQLSQNAQKSGDKLILDLPEKLLVYADRDRFTQIMVNLIQNAIQFTHDGTIQVKGQRLDHAAKFQVIDTGMGMSKEQKKYIFERFFKADPSRARLGTGESGLGLSIVSSLVKQHGGLIKVDSEPNKGSTFTVILFDKGFEQFVIEKKDGSH